ncbi:MAG: type 2 lantipeptide synthetase LanM family protein [Chloroflexi bacterium]|nr:type 2 lantipeptide synthetase LanM family protein [Chloroflexota bacterium]
MLNAKFDTPLWSQAATLFERTGSPCRARGTCQASNKLSREQAPAERHLKRLGHWKGQRPFDQDGYFTQRLAENHLTEEGLLSLLAEPVEALQERLSKQEWVEELLAAFSTNLDADAGLSEALQEKVDTTFLALIKPLIHQMQGAIREVVNELVVQNGRSPIPIDLTTIEDSLFSPLLDELTEILMPVMILELHAAGMLGLLQGETPEARFQSFISRLHQPELALSLLQEYPVLARLLVTFLQNWGQAMRLFLHRLCGDWEDICHTFAAIDPYDCVTHINANAGDRHVGGDRVMIVTFRSGGKLVYKPKPLDVDAHFQALLCWINARGFTPPLATLQLLNCGSHGWVEFVSAQACATEAEVKRFFTRQGGYLVLLTVLKGVDFHYENVIAAGEHPMLIDLETLFHPTYMAAHGAIATAYKQINDSVVNTLLLPNIRLISLGLDIGGMGDAARESTRTALVLENVGTDKMQYAHKPISGGEANHQPHLQGHAINSVAYIDDILAGFRAMYWLLHDHRDELLHHGSPLYQFAADQTRIVLRNTMTYALLLRQCLQPQELRDGLNYEKTCDRLWLEVPDQPHLKQLIPFERSDLWQMDVPFFTTQPGSKNVWSSAGDCIPSYLQESGLELAEKRLRDLCAADYERQIWFLRASFVRAATASELARNPVMVASTGTRSDSLVLANVLGQRIAASAFKEEDHATWVDLYAQEHKWFLEAGNTSLYSGLPGTALFLAHLGRVTGNGRYTTLAQQTINSVLRWVENPTLAMKRALKLIGGFDGWGGIVYALTHLGILWQDEDLLTRAASYVTQILPRIQRDAHLDILSGAAGSIVCLTGLYAHRPSAQVLDVAIQCGDWLLDKAQHSAQGIYWQAQNLQTNSNKVGFANGGSGIAWALLKLHQLSGKSRFYQTAVAGIAYERTVLAAEGPNLPITWCDGITGVGMARLASSGYMDDPQMREEIETAVQSVLATGLGDNHSLCHGAFGNLEFLLQAAQQLPDNNLKARVQQLANDLTVSICQEGLVCGAPLGIETMGLMNGLAGIGYSLLRVANPADIPSLLLLELPRE